MIEYDVYHRKTLFKVIYRQSKPCNHSKYHEIWRNTSKKWRGRKILLFSISTLWNDALQSSKFSCTIFVMSRTRFRTQNLHGFNDFFADMFGELWNKTVIAISSVCRDRMFFAAIRVVCLTECVLAAFRRCPRFLFCSGRGILSLMSPMVSVCNSI